MCVLMYYVSKINPTKQGKNMCVRVCVCDLRGNGQTERE